MNNMHNIRFSARYGSHLPLLIKIMEMTDGPVLELGTGIFSTPILHWMCYLKKRKLLSLDGDLEYIKMFEKFNNDYHTLVGVTSWPDADISGHWNVVLVDHAPDIQRIEEVRRLANSADYIIIHDTEGRCAHKYMYDKIYPLFKYRKDFGFARPFTGVLSNFVDVTKLEV